tara:strand:+ start:678 stop:1145 length:468 start_codon:yes stop_codon:yes gene_type:complete
MSVIIIGIDPDSSKHGIAIYEDFKLTRLESWQLMDLYFYLKSIPSGNTVECHIENVCGNNATFAKSFVKNARSQTTISRSLGMCQQAQAELERAIEKAGVKFYQHKISKNWKDTKTGNKILKDHFHWSGRSNEDTRSAAYFGYLGIKQWRLINQK